MRTIHEQGRRDFLGAATTLGAGMLAIGGSAAADEKPDVGPTEDLMREHGVLNRVLLIYDHFVLRIEQKQDVDPAHITAAANIIHSFVEDYHERQEEQFLFPRFEKAGKLTGLVSVLRTQHQAGRTLTNQMLTLAGHRDPGSRTQLSQSLRQFLRMYRPHEAREDTELFPALRQIVSPHEFDSLGEQFEANEHKQFGADGFELYRDKVANLEKQLGLYDLAQFTPQVALTK